MSNDTIKDIARSERGGALLLAFIGSILLSITGVSMLRQSQTEYSISAHHFFDKTALFAADAGINDGIRALRNSPHPPNVIINQTIPVDYDGRTYHFRSVLGGSMPDTETGPQNIKGMEGLAPSMPAGQALGTFTAAGWDLTVTSRIYMTAADMAANARHKSRKEVQTMLITIQQMGH